MILLLLLLADDAAWVGAEVSKYDTSTSELNRKPEYGVVIDSWAPNSPISELGAHSTDRMVDGKRSPGFVIQEVGGVEVRTPEEFHAAIGKQKPGRSVYLRGLKRIASRSSYSWRRFKTRVTPITLPEYLRRQTKTDTDEVVGLTVISAAGMPELADRTDVGMKLVKTRSSKAFVPVLTVQYRGDDWLFIDSLSVIASKTTNAGGDVTGVIGKPVKLRLPDVKRKVLANANVLEWSSRVLTVEELSEIRKTIDRAEQFDEDLAVFGKRVQSLGGRLVARLHGKDFRKDHWLSASEVSRLRVILMRFDHITKNTHSKNKRFQ